MSSSSRASTVSAIGGQFRGGGYNQFSPFDEAFPSHIRTRLRSTGENAPSGTYQLSGFGVDSLHFRDYGRHDDGYVDRTIYTSNNSQVPFVQTHPTMTYTSNLNGNVPPGTLFSDDWFSGVEAIAQNRRTDDMISSLGSTAPVSYQSHDYGGRDLGQYNPWGYEGEADGLAILNTINSQARDDNFEDLLTANHSVGDSYFAPHLQNKTENTRWSYTPDYWTKLGGFYRDPEYKGHQVQTLAQQHAPRD